ncbi:orc1/cdc6 family replication initiation protein [Haladaptatus litoreus]|uniref:ORC1-type DNA replication protein n=1 Tax=Haladaptatus litoreus TaxID=553468 RepID=A0A1N7DKW5_9EURY|nr:AAA family ATPase [Haladaptatus litoreus]SIR76476.1 orc1/cdc6 family replication initiation protein [Haladaptatus litoreus]
MTRYDDLFDETTPTDSVFADKGALDPLAKPDKIIARDEQERQLATILNGVHEGYLPTTVSIYGPPGTGKTTTTRLVCREFADRTEQVAVEYVNLKECRTLFSAANEILLEVSGERKKAYEGLDGVFASLWEALTEYPEYTILLLDEIDQLAQDSNYDPNDFFYRLLRGEGRLKRGISLSTFLISNELLEVDLRLDSRVQSAMSDEQIFFPPYTEQQLAKLTMPRFRRAFRDCEKILSVKVYSHGLRQAAMRWGDARKTLTLFRHAGETANERELDTITRDCIEVNLEQTDKTATLERITQLPLQHFFVLISITAWTNRRTGEIVQPVTMSQVEDSYAKQSLPDEDSIGVRAMRDIVTDLETMGLIETWIDSRGSDGRVKQVETAFDPEWVKDARPQYIEQSEHLEHPSESE